MSDEVPGKATLLLFNPQSRRGEDIDQARTILSRRRQVLVREVGAGSNPRELVSALRGTIDRLVVAGGDGTIHALLPWILESDLPLGVLPLGTANDLAGTLGLPKDPAEAALVIEAGHIRRVDVGVVNGHHFMNAVGVGLGARLTRELTREAKARWGVAAYFTTLVQVYRDTRPFRAVVECDDRRLALRALQITIGNGRQYGGGMLISDEATVDDAQLDVLCIEPRPLSDLLWHAVAIRRGQARESPVARTARGRRVRITTRRPLDVTADGELVTTTPVEIEVAPRALRVFAPPPEAPESHVGAPPGPTEIGGSLG